MNTNPNLFRLNVFLETTRFKSHKNALYTTAVALYVAFCIINGIGWRQAAVRTIAMTAVAILAFGTICGQTLLSAFASRIPWSRLGFFSVKIIGCETHTEETPPLLFLHKGSSVGQIADWLKFEMGASNGVTLFWAGRELKDYETLGIGIENGSNLVAVLHQEKMGDAVQLGQRQTVILPVPADVPTNPDFDHDTDDDEDVPSFIRDMFSDDDDDDDEEEVESAQVSAASAVAAAVAAAATSAASKWFGNVAGFVAGTVRNVAVAFGDVKRYDTGDNILDIPAPPVAAVVQPPVIDEDSDSDTDDDEVPSFLREMHSDDDDDDDYVPYTPPKKSWISKRWQLFTRWSAKLLARCRSKVQYVSWIRKVDARDMITLEEDGEEIRYMMPCRIVTHAMSQSSLLNYVKNKVNVDKVAEIRCPDPRCAESNKSWELDDILAILRQEDDPEFKCPADVVAEIEKGLSSNQIAQSMNCQRCPQCEVVLARRVDTEGYHCECFGCAASFCWACRAPWDVEAETCLNPECNTSWRFVAAQMLKSCPRKHIDHMPEVPTLRACPECGQLITHVTACKHMRCSLCKTRFCFICVQPQKDGAWQCGYDATSCKLAEQSVDSISSGLVARSCILQRVSPDVFLHYDTVSAEEIRSSRQQFMDDVMASVQNPQFFD